MTFCQFRLLSPEVQLRYVLSEGAYLAQRWESEYQGLNLHYCNDGGRGFFVEVGVDEVAECVSMRGSWRAPRLLEQQVQVVELPEY